MIQTLLRRLLRLPPRPALGLLDAIKVCARCEDAHPVRCFNKHSGRPDGLQPYCKPCQVAHNREYRRRRNALTRTIIDTGPDYESA